MSLRALGGGELHGDRLVRFVYLDESGTGDLLREPHVIVSGVMVHADKQWKRVELYLQSLADEFALPNERRGFFFHAQQLFTGGSATFKQKYPLEKRHAFLMRLCKIPEEFDLPVVCASQDRRYLRRKFPTRTPGALVEDGIIRAATLCASSIEHCMRNLTPEDEVATIVFEQNGNFDKVLRKNHNFFRTKLTERSESDLSDQSKLMRFDRIIDTAHFAGKTDSSILQVADACAYIFQRTVRGATDVRPFYLPIRRNLSFSSTHLMAETGLQTSWEARGLQRPA